MCASIFFPCLLHALLSLFIARTDDGTVGEIAGMCITARMFCDVKGERPKHVHMHRLM